MLERQVQNVDRWLRRVNINKKMAEQAFLTLADASANEYWNAVNSFDLRDLPWGLPLGTAEAERRLKALKALDSLPRKLDSSGGSRNG